MEINMKYVLGVLAVAFILSTTACAAVVPAAVVGYIGYENKTYFEKLYKSWHGTVESDVEKKSVKDEKKLEKKSANENSSDKK